MWRNVVPTFIYRALNHMPLVLDNAGRATRDFIHVTDIVDGLERCALLGEPGGVYNLASGVETSIKDLAETISTIVGPWPMLAWAVISVAAAWFLQRRRPVVAPEPGEPPEPA